MPEWTQDYISPRTAETLHGLFSIRARQSSTKLAYKYYNSSDKQWHEVSWEEADTAINSWQHALLQENLKQGDRVGIMLRNCPQWIYFEQAALRSGLVVVPIFPNDRPDNIAHIVNDANLNVVLIEDQQTLETINQAATTFISKTRIVTINQCNPPSSNNIVHVNSRDWLPEKDSASPVKALDSIKKDDLATIVYTSGTTGLPKGVMLSHWNILSNAYSGIQSITIYHEDLFLSFLPLSHTLERTVGAYIPIMTGASVAFCRSIPELAEDLVTIRPTVLIAVPRIFERVRGRILEQLTAKPPIAQKLFNAAQNVGWSRFEIQQKRESWSSKQLLWPILNKLVAQKIINKLGGRMRFAICGGAPLSQPVAKLFIGLGLPVLQGYGLTESSPIISVNPIENNIPDSIGPPLTGVEVRIADDGELQSRSDSVMLGYWNNEAATKDTFTNDGWLQTGDLAEIRGDHIFITGRKKEILVLSNGEKVPPADIEMAITLDPLFEQALVIGEGQPCLGALIVLNPEEWNKEKQALKLDDDMNSTDVKKVILERISSSMHQFPGYAKVKQVIITLDPWTDENGLLTPSLKMRRKPICDIYAKEIEQIFSN